MLPPNKLTEETIFTKPDITKLQNVIKAYEAKHSNQSNVRLSNLEWDESAQYETNEALLYIEAILNNMTYHVDHKGEENSTFSTSLVLDFEQGSIDGITLLDYLSQIEHIADSIQQYQNSIDSAVYIVSSVDLNWNTNETHEIKTISITVFLQSGNMPILDVPCDILTRTQWPTTNGVTIGLDLWVPDNRTGSPGVPAPFLTIASNYYARSYLVLTYKLMKAVCNPNLTLLAHPANDPNGYWVYNYEDKFWGFNCDQVSNNPNHGTSSKLWTNTVNPPWGAPLQRRAHVIDEYNYIITLANANKPLNKQIVNYQVNGDGQCRVNGNPTNPNQSTIVRRYHTLNVRYGNYFYYSTSNQ